MSKTITLLQPVKLPRYRPFANGSQYWSWFGGNCDQCKKYKEDPETGVEVPGECEIADALGMAAMDNGSVAGSIAARMGYKPGAHAYIWHCPEKVKAENNIDW